MEKDVKQLFLFPRKLVAVEGDTYDALKRKEIRLKDGVTNELMKRLVPSDRDRLRNMVNERSVSEYRRWGLYLNGGGSRAPFQG